MNSCSSCWTIGSSRRASRPILNPNPEIVNRRDYRTRYVAASYFVAYLLAGLAGLLN